MVYISYILYPILSHPIPSHRITSYHMPYHIYHIILYHIISHHITSYYIISVKLTIPHISRHRTELYARYSATKRLKLATRLPYCLLGVPDSNFSLALNINSKLQWHNTYVLGRSLLIFSHVIFKMAAWWPYWYFVSGLCMRHGFGSVTQVCFGISVWNFICMLLVAVGRPNGFQLCFFQNGCLAAIFDLSVYGL